MMMLGAIPSPSQNVIEIGPLTIHFYGILIAVGVIVAIIVSRNRYERFGGSVALFEKAAIWAVVIGFLGARLAYVSTNTARFTERPWAIFYIWEGGLALYGGLIAGTLTVIYLFNKYDGDLFAMGDAVAVGVPLAQAIGRFGNYFNQELFGTPSDLPWAIIIDPSRRPDGYEQFETFHPTFAYEALWNAFVLVPLILVLERRGKLAKSTSFGIYVAMYAVIRFATELLRTDTTFRFLGISRNGWVSVAAFLFGVGWIIWSQRRGEARTLYGKPTFFSPQPANAVLTDSDAVAQSAVDSQQSTASDAGVADSNDQHRPSWARAPDPDGATDDVDEP